MNTSKYLRRVAASAVMTALLTATLAVAANAAPYKGGDWSYATN